MLEKSYQIYRSSAGSGKTRTLAKEYIKLALAGHGDYYKHILAVTFANKATQEMKERILLYLDDFANGRINNLTAEIKDELKWGDKQLQLRSQEVLSGILHHYSHFAISTIDAFFQRVIRSFTREAGLLGSFRLEVDNEVIMDEVLALLLDELGHNTQLTDWVVQFSHTRLKDGENWNITTGLRGFLQEIFKEQFKAIENKVIRPDATAEDHQRTLAMLRKEMKTFMDFMQPRGVRAMSILQQHGIRVDDFVYKDAGTVYKYFNQFSQGVYFSSRGARVQGSLASSNDWANKKSPNAARLKQLAETELIPILREMVDYDKEHYIAVTTVERILENYYAFGLITDVTRKLREYLDENNVMLLSNASQFLNGIINDSDTPFIYEKVGSYFQNYLIDEFQDTSGFQWKNFIPLLKEAGDQGNLSLIVGDVKQSIYRWRGGDLELLQNEITNVFGNDRVTTTPLVTNYRSAGKIIEFNNQFFKAAVPVVTQLVANELPSEVYRDVTQQIAKQKDDGFVRVLFKKGDEGQDWRDEALRDLPGWLEQLQVQGTALKDIAILVRKNEEGQRIANYLLQFRHSPEAKKGFRYDVVSNESLRLDTAQSVNVLISAIKYLRNPDDNIARGQLAFEATKNKGLEQLFVKAKANDLGEYLPAEFIERARTLRKLSLFELTEELIRLFDLGKNAEELAYLQAFQDNVLEFSAREKTDLGSFLEWWDVYKEKKSIQVSASVDAVNILTIHKSKGLQFKYVIIPFCDWSLNHDISPMMWVESDRAPFNKMGPLVVRYSSKLTETLFADAYQAEFTKAHLDNLNLLYVAFTRAEQGLVVFVRDREKDKPSNVGDLVYQTIHQSPLAASVVEGVYQSGEVKQPQKQEASSESTMIQLSGYSSVDWRSKLVIKRQGSEFFEDELSEKRSKINRGILVHQVLSRIEYKSDAEAVLAQFLLETALPSEEAEKLKQDIDALLAHTQIGPWFTKDWTVKTEALILLPGHQQKRVDRIMFGRNRTVLVDYKTGKKKPEDKEQVERYALVLAQMGYPNVQAYLVYLHELKVEEVVNKSNLSLF